MNNKSKHHQSVKVVKESANIRLRKKTKSLTTDKHLGNEKETVWDRLSKIKKSISSEKVSEAENVRPHFVAKTRQRFPSIDNTLVKQSKQPSNKILIKSNSAVKKYLNFSQKTFLKKSENCNEILTPFDDIITSRSLCSDSNYSSDSIVSIYEYPTEHNELVCCHDRNNNEFSEASGEKFTLAPLLTYNSENGTEGKSVGDNSRCEILKDNLKLSDISKTQLDNILMQEFGVEEVLYKLKKDLVEQADNMIEYSDHTKGIQKFEVDVIFKNVPSLDNEIKILRALGEELEAVLKNSHTLRIKQTTSSQISVNSTTRLSVKHDSKTEHSILASIQLKGIRQCVGIIKEFSVAKKSIVELKREASRLFFIPSNCENIQLKETSYKDLKENPNELFRHFRSKNSEIAFNLLDQDPIFFYTALSMPLHISHLLSKKHRNDNPKLAANQGGDTIFETTSNHEAEEHKGCNCLTGRNESEIMGSCKLCNLDKTLLKTYTNSGSTRGKKRGRISHLVTPMPIDYYYCPKNSIVKTILVGFVQVSLFIVFIVALTHPSLRCLNAPAYT